METLFSYQAFACLLLVLLALVIFRYFVLYRTWRISARKEAASDLEISQVKEACWQTMEDFFDNISTDADELLKACDAAQEKNVKSDFTLHNIVENKDELFDEIRKILARRKLQEMKKVKPPVLNTEHVRIIVQEVGVN